MEHSRAAPKRPTSRDPRAVTAYLDHAATTPMRPEAIEAMLPFLGADFANPSGIHAGARRARRAVDRAREALAGAVGCEPDEVVWTSGGTESDNLALRGAHLVQGGDVLVSSVEHRAVLRPAAALGARVLAVTGDGQVDLATLEAALSPAVRLVSVMGVNNEVGVQQPIREIAALVRERAPQALLHCDAVQAFPWLDVAELCASCDLVSLSAHKFGGPKGVGALVVRRAGERRLAPLLLGGPQERELRAGTENVAGIVAAAVAAEATVRERAATVVRVAALRDQLVDGLRAAWPAAVEVAPRALRVAGSAHLCFPGVEAEELVLLLDAAGVAASTGSACASGAREASHVLLAMGCSMQRARASVRFSLGATSTSAEITHALAVVPRALARLSGSD